MLRYGLWELYAEKHRLSDRQRGHCTEIKVEFAPTIDLIVYNGLRLEVFTRRFIRRLHPRRRLFKNLSNKRFFTPIL